VTPGFRAESFEKATRLLSLLEALRSHAFLRPRLALKGGTALNLFLFEAIDPRIEALRKFVVVRDKVVQSCSL
jgi:hypothetical protein